jgi:hypothetical protein
MSRPEAGVLPKPPEEASTISASTTSLPTSSGSGISAVAI